MFWKYGLFFSILSGGIWGIFWQIFFTVIGILTLGIPLSLELSQIMIIGPLAGILYIKSQKFLSIKFHLTAIIIITFLIFISHLGNPFQAEDENRLIIFMLILLTSFFLWVSLNHSLYNLSPGKLSKHDIESFLIKFMWGIGLIILILITLIPFYIMIMTSLKNQQSLILNPLDLSVNLNTNLKTLFNSYIELFTNFNFHLFLINSFIVSCTTVIITLFFSIPGAYALARLRIPNKKIFSGTVILIYLIPSIVLIIPLYAVFSLSLIHI